jgi:cytochrome b558/566 subunit A
MNSTGNWIIGTGLFHGGGVCNVNPTIDLEGFTVRAKGLWESNLWTLEVARPFTTVANNMPYSIQFEQGQTYPVSFAVFDGYQGEVMETNSISDWMNIELSSQYTYLEQDVLNAAQAAQDATQAADETRKIAETSTTLAYASIAVSAIAIILSAISLSRKRE